MTQISVTVTSAFGEPIAFVGSERECGNYVDKIARHVYDNSIQVGMQFQANPIPQARLIAYTRFAMTMEKLDGEMLLDFDYKVLMETVTPEKPQ